MPMGQMLEQRPRRAVAPHAGHDAVRRHIDADGQGAEQKDECPDPLVVQHLPDLDGGLRVGSGRAGDHFIPVGRDDPDAQTDEDPEGHVHRLVAQVLALLGGADRGSDPDQHRERHQPAQQLLEGEADECLAVAFLLQAEVVLPHPVDDGQQSHQHSVSSGTGPEDEGELPSDGAIDHHDAKGARPIVPPCAARKAYGEPRHPQGHGGHRREPCGEALHPAPLHRGQVGVDPPPHRVHQHRPQDDDARHRGARVLRQQQHGGGNGHPEQQPPQDPICHNRQGSPGDVHEGSADDEHGQQRDADAAWHLHEVVDEYGAPRVHLREDQGDERDRHMRAEHGRGVHRRLPGRALHHGWSVGGTCSTL
mmetsp:Transcript_40299/g.115790  ORF Transcript_40299/g.115790 Transcript_40299/m.115790 type:complete len:364 (+) Transcript_40299:1019-2110(+)